MQDQMVATLLDITRAAGALIQEARTKGIVDISATKGAALSQTDLDISAYAQNKLKPLIKTGSHLLIDEEDKKNSSYFTETFLNTPEYIWSIDPIDATRDFIVGTPFYAVTIGIFKNKKPHMGAVYFPAFGELYWNDGEKSYLVTLPFTDAEQHYNLNQAEVDIKSNQFFYASSGFWRTYDTNIHPSRNLGAHCFHLMWTCKGWGKATVFKNHIWDFAGSWAVIKDCGLGFYNITTQQEITELSLDLFSNEPGRPWLLKDFVLCTTAFEKDNIFKAISKK